MTNLMNLGLLFIVFGVIAMIGTAVLVKAYDTVKSQVNDTLLDTVKTDSGNAISTFTSFLGILAIAAIGGVAIAYVTGFLGGNRGVG